MRVSETGAVDRRLEGRVAAVANVLESRYPSVSAADPMRALMPGIVGDPSREIRWEVFEIPAGGGPGVRRYDSGVPDGQQADDALRRERLLQLGGREWRLRGTQLPAFRDRLLSRASLVLASGLGLSTLLALLLLSRARGEHRARDLADTMTRQLREAQQERERIIESTADGILTLRDDGSVLTFNRAAGRMFGYSSREVVGRSVSLLLPPPFQSVCQEALSLFQASQDGRSSAGLRREVVGRRRNGEEFPVQLALNVTTIAGRPQIIALVSDISERKRDEARMRHIAHHDALTGLPNRYLLSDRLDIAIKQSQRDRDRVAVLMIDLDHFKHINDSLGHPVGDQVLLAVAERLRGCLRDSDTVARMGGDEFVVVMPGVPGRDAVNRVAEAIVRQVSRPVTVGEAELHVTPSVGICLYPDDGDDVHALLKNADTALYRAKAQGRANHQWFTGEMRQDEQWRHELERDLRRALEQQQFSLVYQPQVAVTDRRLIGLEALVRWRHPQQGLVMPARFIPLAEETGLIVPLGAWILRTACLEIAQARRQSGQALPVSVNVSPRQFRQAAFADQVRGALTDSGLPPEALTLEITESVLADNPDEALKQLHALRAMGVSLDIDDFGTGYSSLSYVTRFPLAKLKIDRRFMSRIPDSRSDAAVAEAIVAMGHSLNLKVLAEGVETAEQHAFLKAIGCDEAQGFLFGTPRALPEILAMAGRDAAPVPPAREPLRLIAHHHASGNPPAGHSVRHFPSPRDP